MAKTMFEDVGEFHTKFGLPVAGSGPCRLPDFTTIEYRVKFLEEELNEFIEACDRGSLVDACDALVDLAWVAFGTLHYFKAPGDELWAEVRRANMEKVTETTYAALAGEQAPEHKRGRVEKIRKPPGWKEPDVLRVIREHNTALKRRARVDVGQRLDVKLPGDDAAKPMVVTNVGGPEFELIEEVSVEAAHPLGCSCKLCGFDESD